MRLIDADKLLLHLADYQLQEAPAWGANGYGNADKYEAITECIKAIEESPAIDAKDPRPAGHWMTNGEEPICSECGNMTADYYEKEEADKSVSLAYPRFCGWCGARMEQVNINRPVKES